MKKEKIDLRSELRAYKFELDLLQRIPCSKEENQEYARICKEGGELPKGVYAYVSTNGEQSAEFYTIYEAELTEQELAEYLALRKLSMLRTIKNCVLFFTVLTIIGLVAIVLLFLGAN